MDVNKRSRAREFLSTSYYPTCARNTLGLRPVIAPEALAVGGEGREEGAPELR